ncbi:hypothetical protein [Pedobacter ureilyticus]|uniref:Uncharacterized protein n=1 Tax=Pedobacter ureilyticus TaxID=1393051 RepID=A0ABW9J9P6_9SPHI|nr:hypothetical protein [Pedobacter helvus]
MQPRFLFLFIDGKEIGPAGYEAKEIPTTALRPELASGDGGLKEDATTA